MSSTQQDVYFKGDLSFSGVLPVKPTVHVPQEKIDPRILTESKPNVSRLEGDKLEHKISFSSDALLIQAAKCVVRIYCTYLSNTEERTLAVFTGFFIAPTILLTAPLSSLYAQHTIESVEFSLKFDDLLNTKKYKAKILPIESKPPKFLEASFEQFGFLLSTQYISDDYAIPRSPPLSGTCATISVPLTLNFQQTGKEDSKVVSCGTFKCDGDLILHEAPTFPSSQGGMLVVDDKYTGDVFFSGIAGEHTRNIAFSVDSPTFLAMYRYTLKNHAVNVFHNKHVLKFLSSEHAQKQALIELEQSPTNFKQE